MWLCTMGPPLPDSRQALRVANVQTMLAQVRKAPESDGESGTQADQEYATSALGKPVNRSSEALDER
jgi:hypothetical protein